MSILNAALGGLLDLLLLPFRAAPPWLAFGAVCAGVSVLMLLVIKRTSNQRAVTAVKAKIQADLYEMRLFNDDPAAIFRALFQGLAHNGVYLGLSLVPVAWMIVPLGLTLLHLHSRFGYEPLATGQVTMVRATLAEGWRAEFAGVDEGGRPPISLEPSAAVDVLTPAVWLPSKNEVLWKVEVRQPGAQVLQFKLGDKTYTKSVWAGGGLGKRSPVRPDGGFLGQILHPWEAPLPKGPLRSLEVGYADAGAPWLDTPRWVWIFFVLSIVFAFALKGPMHVEI